MGIGRGLAASAGASYDKFLAKRGNLGDISREGNRRVEFRTLLGA